MSERRLFLFDIAAYLHRAMYVVHGDRAAEADPNDPSLAKLACSMLANTMETLNVERMAVVCDSFEPSLRCDEYADYKKKRKPHYPVFTAQAPRFFESLIDVSVAVIERPRYEADDLIASMLYPHDSYVIVSSDKDLLAQLDGVGRVKFYDPMKAIWIGPADVRAKYGVESSQLYDYVGLVGDATDGIPGVTGIGAKTAAKLLCDFDSLDEIYSPERTVALSEFCSKKQFANLMACRDAAFLSRSLALPRLCKHLPYNDSFDAPAPGIVRKACG